MDTYIIYMSFIFGLLVSLYLRNPDLPFMLLLGSKTLCFALTIKKAAKFIGQKIEPLQLAGLSAMVQLYMFMNNISVM